MKKKTHKLIFILIICLISGCVLNNHKYESSSPTGKYRLLFNTIPKRNSSSLISQDVYFSLYSEASTMFENRLFFESGSWDKSFHEKYPDLRWVANNVFRLGEKIEPDKSLYDEVTINNYTDKAVFLLSIKGKGYEEFLIINLLPHSTVNIYTQTQTDSDSSWIAARAEFDNNKIVSSGMNFRIKGQYRGMMHYCVSITDQEIIVQSQEFEGVLVLSETDKTKNKSIPKGCLIR